ncbi:hypothetical protein BGZ61DRAFT_475567 [Ilyonectria robusta]|uniref:uncharacterized protein n=1 Tax=Ilyonectria robusta TaxID=1079257 RepID=UPI001E8EC500|nr:uncharacterized protein BGZ61DRAFT_475567 [Ilyonectria robusta]KAH8721601.1 hypothetical protein BGZ61DRAFT_475567 [Ilyonectria robusta]
MTMVSQIALQSNFGYSFQIFVLWRVSSAVARRELVFGRPDIAPTRGTCGTRFRGVPFDRYAPREAIRTDIKLMTSNETVIGREIISGEVSEKPLTINSTDDEVNARIRENGAGCYHPSGTASMGKVPFNLDTTGVYPMEQAW